MPVGTVDAGQDLGGWRRWVASCSLAGRIPPQRGVTLNGRFTGPTHDSCGHATHVDLRAYGFFRKNVKPVDAGRGLWGKGMLICEQAGDLCNTSNRASVQKKHRCITIEGGVVKIRENDMENGDTNYKKFQVSAKDVPSTMIHLDIRGPAGWRPVYDRLSV